MNTQYYDLIQLEAKEKAREYREALQAQIAQREAQRRVTKVVSPLHENLEARILNVRKVKTLSKVTSPTLEA